MNGTAHTVKVDTTQVLQDDFLGLGVNIIPTALMENNRSKGYDEALWEIDRRRILTLAPKVARVWFQIDWMEPKKGTYTWESAKMLALYAYLDPLLSSGTEVELNFGWKVGRTVHDWFGIEGVPPRLSAPADPDAYAASASALLDELVNRRGYSNVKYLSFYNEPAGDYDFEAPGDQRACYAQMAKAVHLRLIADGRRDLVEIWGPEEWGAPVWTRYMQEHAAEVFDVYSFHVYGGTYASLSGEIAKRVDAIGGKPVALTEFGFPGLHDSCWEAGYGNYAIKLANEGVRTGLAWQLNGVWLEDPDEDVDTNGTYTLWDSLLVNRVPNPRYTEFGLLARYVPAHSSVVVAETSSPDVRAAAFVTGDGGLTVVVEVNEGGDSRSLTIDLGGQAATAIHKFVHTGEAPPGEDGLLTASSGAFPPGPSLTDTDIGPARHLIVYTTTRPAAQVAISPVHAGVAPGDSLTLRARVIDGPDDVTWSVVGAGNGTIGEDGAYTPPQVRAERRVAVRASLVDDPGVYGVAVITVSPE
ncbi:glycoside hydrolase [Streptomyces aculeolatus]